MTPSDNGQLWHAILDQLQMQMTQATFETWVKDTYVVSGNLAGDNGNGNSLVIGVKSASAKDWLENRLFPTINRTVTSIIGQSVDIRFVVNIPAEHDSRGWPASEEGGSEEPVGEQLTTEEEDPAISYARETDFYKGKIEMGRWLAVTWYDINFWQPYLERIHKGTWQSYWTLLSMWIDYIADTKGRKKLHLLDTSKPKNQTWTTPFRISYRDLTRQLGSSNAKLVPGGTYECHRSDQARRILGQPLSECCGAYEHHDWQPLKDGSGCRCYYWRPGLVHYLFDAHLLAIEISSTGRATVQVWRSLPVMTPYQVKQLDDKTQERHEWFIENFGDLFNNLTLERWSSFTIKSMVPYRPGWSKDRQCHGQPPENPFLKKQNNEQELKRMSDHSNATM